MAATRSDDQESVPASKSKVFISMMLGWYAIENRVDSRTRSMPRNGPVNAGTHIDNIEKQLNFQRSKINVPPCYCVNWRQSQCSAQDLRRIQVPLRNQSRVGSCGGSSCVACTRS